ncbi:MAG: TonB-dependent receptor [Paludibacter sp.]|nr:TonB-dependent receptor [Paludibacter sp.]
MNHKKNQMKNVATHHFCTSFYVALILVSSLLLNPFSVIAQTTQHITVKGQILDETKTPIIGASIVAEDTKTGTITDLEGYFSIRAIPNSTLSISYIGYTTQRVKASLKPIVITMTEDVAKLDEVVVVGYGQVKRANLTGAVSSVSMKDLQDIPAPNLSSVLMGTMPGVHVSEATGNVVGTSSISVRINGSWNAEDPLFVIDGFIRDQDAFNLLDQSEIENISVLKDAAASVYGVRGAGGVILVTTKKGKAGKAKVNYSTSFGANQGVELPQMMSAYQQGVALNDLWQQEITYKGVDPATKKMFTQAELDQMKTLNYNWLDQAWKSAINTRHTLNVSGGSEDVQYFVGGSYMYADGNFKNLSMNRYGMRVGVNADLTKHLKGSFSLNYSAKNTEMPLNSKDKEAERMYGTFSDLVRAPRFIPAYINGIPVGNSIPTNGTHPLEVMNSGSYRRNQTQDISGGVSLEYSFPTITGLKVAISGNYGSNSGYGKQLSKPYYVYNFIPQGTDQNSYLISDVQWTESDARYRTKITNDDKLYEAADFSYSYQLNPQISYANKFGKHDISTMLMFEQSESGGNGLNAYRTGVVIDNYEVMGGYSQDGLSNNSTIKTLSRRQSFIGRLNYNYAQKYFVEGATRYEASTNFAPGYRWGLFPSLALAWRISEESFFRDNIDFMDNMKLRMSYGRLGSDKASLNQWRSSYGSTSGGAYIGGTSLATTLYPTEEGLVVTYSTWEKSDSYNGGLDMRFFNELTVGFDGFYRHTFDILDDYKSQFPQTSGVNASTPKLNKGIQDSWGGEFDISYNKSLNKDWSIQVKVNMAYATSFVIQKSQNPGVVGTWQDEVGRIRGGEVGYFSTGIARTQDQVDAYIAELKQNSTTGTTSIFSVPEADLKPGMLMFKDVGGPRYQDDAGKWHDGAPDGIIDENDQRIISKYDSAPYSYAFTLGFTWKDFKVDALFTGQFGNDVIFDKGFYTTASGGSRTGDFLSTESNQLAEWYGNYWTESNLNSKYPRLDSYSFRDKRSTFWLRDGHTLQLRNVNVSYNLPQKFAKSIGIDRFRIFFTGSNLWTIINPYPYKDASVGFWSDYPMIRTFNFGLNLSF